MEVILLRHGQTAGNRAHRYIGGTDEPLCEAGITALRTAGPFPAVPHVYVSPMLRAKQTAALLFPNADQTEADGLREMNFGDFEGRSAYEMINDTAYRTWVEGGCISACPGGEAMGAYTTRVCAAFYEIVLKAIARAEQRVIIVAHGGSIMAIMCRCAKPQRDFYHWYVRNGCGYRASLDEAVWAEHPVFSLYEEGFPLPAFSHFEALEGFPFNEALEGFPLNKALEAHDL